MQPLPNHVVMMQIDCEVINTGLVHIKEDAIPIHLSAQMRSEPSPDSPSASAATNSSLQRNDSQKSYEKFRDYQNKISAPSKLVESHGQPVIRLRTGGNMEERSTIQSSYQTETFQKDEHRLIKRKFRHFSGTNLDRFSKLSPTGRLRGVNHS
jgi:hypothetical protein